MAYQARSKRADEVSYLVAHAVNATRAALVSTNVHKDTTPELVTGDWRNPTVTAAAVSAADATNEATLVTLCKDLRAIYALHVGDSVAHKVADSTNTVAAAEPSTTATCITWLNEAKADYTAHIASTTFHYTADATNTIAAADATNEASAITLANELKADLNAHIAAALGGHGVRIPGVH